MQFHHERFSVLLIDQSGYHKYRLAADSKNIQAVA